jgi:hypothetical protein
MDLYPQRFDSIHSHCHDDVNSILNILKEFQRILGYRAPPQHVLNPPVLLRTSHKINGNIDCYPTTSSKAADLIDSYIEVGGNNNNKDQKSTANDNGDEQVAGIHATDSFDQPTHDEPDANQSDDIMNAVLAAVQDGGQEDPNYYEPLEEEDINFESEQVAGIYVVVDKDEESIDISSGSSSYHLSDHYYCPSDNDEYPTSSDDDESSIDSDMPELQPRLAEFSCSDDEETVASNVDASADEDGDEDSIQGSISDTSSDGSPISNKGTPNGFTLHQFNSQTVIPLPTTTPLYMVPPVSCVVIPNDSDDVNSSTASPANERVDPTGHMPVRIQQDCFAHVDDVICHKPTIVNIGGEPIHN